jgi:hypothetical protein
MRLFFVCVTSVVLLLCFGCRETLISVISLLPEKSWHERLMLNAEDYFDDPKIISFCQAIGKGDMISLASNHGEKFYL